MKCVAYCRVSTDSDEQMNSLQNQIAHYTELFAKEGYEGADCGIYYSRSNRKEQTKFIKSLFCDEGISGTKLKNRGAFKYMLECAYRKEFDVIYVKNIQRWARSVEDGAGILKKLKVMGIKVIFEDGNLNNFEHEMTINILLSTAQEESRAKSVAIQFGVRKAQENKKFISGIPYGYNKANGYLCVNPKEAEVVREIYNLYVNEGWGSTRISRHLNHKMIPTKTNKRWTQIQVLNILSNSLYAGIQTAHTIVSTDINIDTVKHVDPQNQREYVYRSAKKVDPEEWIVHEIEDLRIISDEIFQLAKAENRKRKELNQQSIRKSTAHTFSNLLYCGYCGRALRRKKLCTWVRKDGTRDLKFEWVCTNYDMSHRDVCSFRNSWEEKKLIEEVKNQIKRVQENEEVLDKLFQDYVSLFLSSEQVVDEILETEKRINDLKAESRALLRMVAKQYITDEQYKEQNDACQAQIKELKNTLYKLQQIEDEKNMAAVKYKRYKEGLKKFNVEELGVDETKSNLFLKKIINRIEFIEAVEGTKHLNIVWNMLDKNQSNIERRNIPIFV